MEKIKGVPVGDVWEKLDDNQKAHFVSQLRDFTTEWQNLPGQFYGALWQLPCEDVFFHHCCLLPPYEVRYGPYLSREEYNHGLMQALINSRPLGESQFEDAEKLLIQRLCSLNDDTIVFSHGDLHLGNIFVDDLCNITGILDWGEAGFSIKEREYVEARSRARNPEWIKALDEIFGDQVKVNSEPFIELNKALVEYSGF